MAGSLAKAVTERRCVMQPLFDRDEHCRADVGRMAELGRFGEEFAFYICAYWHKGKVKYHISEQPDESYDYWQNVLLQGLCPAPVQAYSQRFMIPSGMREGIKQRARIEFAKRVRQSYPQAFFQLLAHYGSLAPNNSAYPLLQTVRSAYNGFFDLDHLRLYESLLKEAYVKRLLTQQSYSELNRWLGSMWEQPGLYDAPRDRETRTFSGFISQSMTGQTELVSGLPQYKVMIQRYQHQMAGRLTTPIFSKTYWFSEITKLNAIRQQFAEEATAYLTGDYLAYVQTLQQLPSVLAGSDFWEEAAQLEQTIGAQAGQALRWYGQLYNG